MKLLLKLVGGLVLLVVLAVGTLLLWADPNDFKPELQTLAREQGQVELRLKGDIGWSLYPSIALSLPALEVLTLAGKPLASLQRGEIAVRILPLLSGQLQIKGLLLDGLRLDWTVPPDPVIRHSATVDSGGTQASAEQPSDKKGAAPASAEQPSDKKGAAPPADSGRDGAPRFDIGSIRVTNAQLRYADPVNAQVFELRNVNLRADDLISGRSFPARVDFELAIFQGQSAQPQWLAVTQLQAQFLVDLAQRVFGVSALQLGVAISAESMPGGAQSKPLDLQLSGDVWIDLSQDRAEIQGLKLALANLLLAADMNVTSMATSPVIAGQLQLAPFDLKQLLAELGLPELQTQDASVLRQIGLQGSLAGTAETIGLEQLTLTLDQSTIEGAVSFQLASGSHNLMLVIDQIDVDRYLPPETEADAAAAEAPITSAAQTGAADPVTSNAGGRYSKAPLLPVETLKALRLDADLSIDQLAVAGLSLQQLKLSVAAHDGLIQFKQLSGDLYEGRFSNRATIDARRQPLRLDIHQQVSDIQLGALLMDLAEVDRFSGRFSMQGQYRAEGNSVYDIVHTLDGQMQLGLKQGRLKGVDLGDTLCRGILKLQGQQPPAETAQAYTEFSNLNATAVITDGVVANNDLKAALVGITLSADGQTDLPAETLNYAVSLAVLQEFASDNCRIDKRLHNLALPLRCEGRFDTDPAQLCGVDRQRIKQVIGKASRAEAKQKLQQKLEEQLDKKLKDNESVKGLLKGLFK